MMRNRLFSVLLIGAVTIKNSRLYRYIYIENGIYFIILQHTSQFIDLSEFGFDVNKDSLKDVKQIDDDTLLILVGNKLLRYQISENTVLSEKEVDPHSFHIWVK